MSRGAGWMVLAAWMAIGCGKPTPGGMGESSNRTAADAMAIPRYTDLTPGDTAGMLSLMRRTMSGIDANLDSLERRDTVVALDSSAVTDSMVAADTTLPHRELTLWLDHGVPVKLLVRVPSETGRGWDETAYWFLEGRLAVMLGPDDGVAMEDGRILLWTDGGLEPVGGVDVHVRMARELELDAIVKRWLTLLGVPQEESPPATP